VLDAPESNLRAGILRQSAFFRLLGPRDGLIAISETANSVRGTLQRQMVAVAGNDSRGSLG